MIYCHQVSLISCWANENWSRKWDGGEQEILIKQDYSEEDDIQHIRWLCKNVFCDKRYIRVDNKSVFIVYRTALFPNLKKTVQVWREIAHKEFDMELYLMHADFPSANYPDNPTNYGMDASFDFQPIAVWKHMPKVRYERLLYWLWRIRILRSRKWFRSYVDNLPDVYSYKDYVEYMKRQVFVPRRYPCVSPGFDNSSRRVGRNFLYLEGGTPQLYGEWLGDYLKRFSPFTPNENFVFINAWNEWAEGNHLEPDTKWGKAYLEETKRVISAYSE